MVLLMSGRVRNDQERVEEPAFRLDGCLEKEIQWCLSGCVDIECDASEFSSWPFTCYPSSFE